MILRFFALRMGILNTQTSEFGMGIAEALGHPKDRFPKLSQPGTILGMLYPEIAQAVGGNCKIEATVLGNLKIQMEAMEK